MKQKIKIWWKQFWCNHVMQADNCLGWECMHCGRKAKTYRELMRSRWNGETDREHYQRARYY